jgi:hypothetical protein
LANYTFHRLESDGTVIATSRFDCVSDDAALAHAMEYAGCGAVEVWRDDERIAYIEGGLFGLKGVAKDLGLPDCEPHDKPSDE